MKKSDIVEYVRTRTHLTKLQSIHAVETILAAIKQELSEHGNVIVRGFGEFSVRHKGQRVGRDPKRNLPAVVPARSVVRFKAGRKFKELVNNN